MIRTTKVFMIPNLRNYDVEKTADLKEFLDLLIKSIQDFHDNSYKDLKWLDENKT